MNIKGIGCERVQLIQLDYRDSWTSVNTVMDRVVR